MTDPNKTWLTLKRKFGIETQEEGDTVAIELLVRFKNDCVNETISKIKRWIAREL